FRARLLDLDFQPGIESLEARLFTEAEIPWEQIAFRTVHATLQQYFADRRAGSFDFHFGDIRTR
ncbi:MAG: NUDIX hydrolase, partial [Pseudomonadota bacterium]